MKRRIVLAGCVAGLVAGVAVPALAAPVQTRNHQICVAIAQNDNYNAADYYCVDVTPPSH